MSTHVRFIDRDFRTQCAFPIDAEPSAHMMVCGEQSLPGAHYCARHHAIVWQAPKDTGGRYVRSLRRWAA
jgi:hypothetical protein